MTIVILSTAMRYPEQQKAATRATILNAAARLFRESGYDGVGIDAIMAESGLTPGGFYAHFSSKEALFAEAMTTALDARKTLRAANNSDPSTTDRLTKLIKSYLSRAHRESVADGCPLPVLTADVARKSDATRETYERQFLTFIDQIEELLPNAQEESRERALAIVAAMCGRTDAVACGKGPETVRSDP
jgi:AcrR family transcriptional regulator